jgi:hypothetical protein
MFYGGRLLSHLSADDPEVTEFISLRRLNRYIGIIMDSDKASPQSRVNDTKKRIEREFAKGPGFAWITAGREIENYLDPLLVESAIKESYPRAHKLIASGKYDHLLGYVDRQGAQITRVDKVKIAHRLANHRPSFDFLDLGAKIEEVIRFIRSANDL